MSSRRFHDFIQNLNILSFEKKSIFGQSLETDLLNSVTDVLKKQLNLLTINKFNKKLTILDLPDKFSIL